MVKVGTDLGVLVLDLVRLDGLSEQASDRLAATLVLVLENEPPRRLGQDDCTGNNNCTPDELNSNWDTVRRIVRAILCGIHHARSDEETEGDEELVGRDDESW